MKQQHWEMSRRFVNPSEVVGPQMLSMGLMLNTPHPFGAKPPGLVFLSEPSEHMLPPGHGSLLETRNFQINQLFPLMMGLQQLPSSAAPAQPQTPIAERPLQFTGSLLEAEPASRHASSNHKNLEQATSAEETPLPKRRGRPPGSKDTKQRVRRFTKRAKTGAGEKNHAAFSSAMAPIRKDFEDEGVCTSSRTAVKQEEHDLIGRQSLRCEENRLATRFLEHPALHHSILPACNVHDGGLLLSTAHVNVNRLRDTGSAFAPVTPLAGNQAPAAASQSVHVQLPALSELIRSLRWSGVLYCNNAWAHKIIYGTNCSRESSLLHKHWGLTRGRWRMDPRPPLERSCSNEGIHSLAGDFLASARQRKSRLFQNM